jgi:hypothetical protein
MLLNVCFVLSGLVILMELRFIGRSPLALVILAIAIVQIIYGWILLNLTKGR